MFDYVNNHRRLIKEDRQSYHLVTYIHKLIIKCISLLFLPSYFGVQNEMGCLYRSSEVRIPV